MTGKPKHSGRIEIIGVVIALGMLLLLRDGSLNQTEASHQRLFYSQPTNLLATPTTEEQPPISSFFVSKEGDSALPNKYRSLPVVSKHHIAPEPEKGAEKFASLQMRDVPRRLSVANLNMIENFQSPASLPMALEPRFSPSDKTGVRWKRLALVQTGSAGVALYAFQKFDEYFGDVAQPFRVGNDWNKDHTLHADELLHFQGSYRITQGLMGLYRWCGLESPWAECIGAGTAATVMTFLEYLDGRRPSDEASYSDFIANFLGVGFALAKGRVAALQDFDVQFSYRAPTDVFQRQTLLKYDRMTHWLTYSLKRRWNIPLHVGLGYGIRDAFKSNVQSELYLGIGLTPVDILERYYPAAAKPLAWLGIYHLGWQFQVK
jgi:hypothetical protein